MGPGEALSKPFTVPDDNIALIPRPGCYITKCSVCNGEKVFFGETCPWCYGFGVREGFIELHPTVQDREPDDHQYSLDNVDGDMADFEANRRFG